LEDKVRRIKEVKCQWCVVIEGGEEFWEIYLEYPENEPGNVNFGYDRFTSKGEPLEVKTIGFACLESVYDFVLSQLSVMKASAKYVKMNPQANEGEFLDKVSRAYKMKLLRIKQARLGEDIMDEFAVKLNSEPTYEEKRHIKFMWELFKEMGAIIS
jgi:hypothetical protein